MNRLNEGIHLLCNPSTNGFWLRLCFYLVSVSLLQVPTIIFLIECVCSELYVCVLHMCLCVQACAHVYVYTCV